MPRPPLFLAILTLGVVAFIVFKERHWQGTRRAVDTELSVFEVPPDAVEVVLIRNDSGDIRLERVDGDVWMLLDPVEERANGDAVFKLLAAMDHLEYRERFELETPDDQLKEYGLDRPRGVVKARWAEEQVELRLGADSPFGNAVYAQVQKGSPWVYAVPREIFDVILAGPSAWRDRSVIRAAPEAVHRVALFSAGPEIELERSAQGWQIRRPIVARGRSGAVERLLEEASFWRVQRFVADDKDAAAGFGLNRPAAGLRLFGANGDLLDSILVGEPASGNTEGAGEPEFMAKRDGAPSVFTVATNVVGTLQTPVNAFRDPAVTGVNWQDVSRVVVVQQAGGRMAAFRSGRGWRLERPEAPEANGDQLDAFVRLAATLQASRFVADAPTDLGAFGLTNPVMTVELFTPMDEAKGGVTGHRSALGTPAGVELAARLTFGRRDQDERFVVNEAEPFVYAIPESTFDMLEVKPWMWRGTRVVSVERDNLTRMEVRRGQSVWRWTAPPDGQSSENLDEEALVRLVCDLRTSGWQPPDRKAPDRAADWEIQLESDQGTHRMRIWLPKGDESGWGLVEPSEGGLFALASADLSLLIDLIGSMGQTDAR